MAEKATLLTEYGGSSIVAASYTIQRDVPVENIMARIQGVGVRFGLS